MTNRGTVDDSGRRLLVGLAIAVLLVAGSSITFRFLLEMSSSRSVSREKPSNSNEIYNVASSGLQDSYDTGSNVLATSCVFPNVNMYEPSVMEIAGLNATTIQCEGLYLPDLTYIEGTTIIVNTSKIAEVVGQDTFLHCKYRHVWRNETNEDNYTFSDWSEPFKNKVQLPKNSEFLRVQCWKNYSEIVSNRYFHLVPRKEEFDEIDAVNSKKRQMESSPKETLNIVMIAFDSLQRFQFIRGSNKTYSFLTNKLKSFDFTMHSQLGLNTFPNFLPLFTGHSEKEVMKWWDYSKHLDSFDMLWKTFENAGYCTMYTESTPIWGAFHFRTKGFQVPFARFYPRPLELAIDDDVNFTKHSMFCAGNQLELNMRFDYTLHLLDTFPDKPVFAVAMMSTETHDNQVNAKRLDDHIVKFYKTLEGKGHLNNTVLVTFSDHGTRYGDFRDSVNGFFESRTPFLIVTFPEWFLKKYPDVAENLRINTKRLTTHFDTRVTLLDLLYFKSESPPPLPPNRHGQSLLSEIPWNRTCADASIPLEFCMCNYKEAEDIDIKSQFSQKLANRFMGSLNWYAQRSPLCSELHLKQLLSVTRITFHGKNDDVRKETAFYKVKLQTIPGDGIFETYVYVEGNSNMRIAENVFRVNSYKGQSDCNPSVQIRAYCYCKDLLTKH